MDTNVILDFALEREKFVEDAEKILRLAFTGYLKAFITATTVTDIFFIVKKHKNKLMAMEFLTELIGFVDISDVNKKVVLESLKSEFTDIEDAIQEFSARNNNIYTIVTRNTNDFRKSELQILTPKEFLKINHKN